MDLVETKDNRVVARFELPGMDQEKVSVEVRNDRLTISGEKKTETDGGRFVVREHSFGRFARTLQLPEGTKVRPHTTMNELVADATCLSQLSLNKSRRIWRRGSWRSAFRRRLRNRRPKPSLLRHRLLTRRKVARNKSRLEQLSL